MPFHRHHTLVHSTLHAGDSAVRFGLRVRETHSNCNRRPSWTESDVDCTNPATITSISSYQYTTL